MARAQGPRIPGGVLMARFVVFAFGDGSPVAVNPEYVTDVMPRMGRPERTDILLVNSNRNDDGTVVTVRGSFEAVVARLNGDQAAAVRLHPSILVDDQPPAWSPAKPTDGGAS